MKLIPHLGLNTRKKLAKPIGYVKVYASEELWLDYNPATRELTVTCRDINDSDREPRWYKFDSKQQLSDFIFTLQHFEKDMW